MITQDIKSNINKIDSELKNLFENVYINENSKGNQFYFDINVNTLLLTSEGSGYQRCEVKARILKTDILNQKINWSYLSNPLNENSDWIERVSTIESISKDIYEVAVKRRMENSYFEKLEIIVDSINENSTSVDTTTFKDKIQSIIEGYGIKVTKFEYNLKPVLENNSFMTTKSDENFKFYHNEQIKFSDMFKLESDLKSILNLDWVVFKEGYIEINNSYEN